MQEKRKRKFNLGSAVGWLIFILMLGGGSLFKKLIQALQGVVLLPTNSVPYMIAGLAVLGIVVSVVRSIGRTTRERGETYLPTGMPSWPNAPMPPFSQPSGVPRLPTSRLPPGISASSDSAQPYRPGETRVPATPRFDPIVNSGVVVIGLVGLVMIGLLALLMLGAAWL